jgi:hypothetical protein
MHRICMDEIPPAIKTSETHGPPAPVFGRIAIVAAALLLILLVFAWAFIRYEGHKLVPQQTAPTPAPIVH